MAPQSEAPSTPAGACSARRSAWRSGPTNGACSGATSPRKRGALAKTYEGRFGTSAVTTQESSPGSATPNSGRPSRKPGVQKFTDPMNPFAREYSKKMTHVEDARKDDSRAGGRTRNPGMIPRTDMAGSERAQSEDGRPTYPFVAHQYSCTGDWRPGKRVPEHGTPCATPVSARSPRCSEGMASTLPDGHGASTARTDGHGASTARSNVLENYLNDMKRCQKSLRNVPATPSVYMQRINDERVKLPAERRFERVAPSYSARTLTNTTLDASSEHTFSIAQDLLGGSRPQSARIRRSFSCDPRIQRSVAQGEVNEREDNYGFTRKREVNGGWTNGRGTSNLLHHNAGHNDPQPLSSPRRSERLERKADERFSEMVAHMKAANPEQRLQFEHFKTRSEHSAGLISHQNGSH